MAAGWREVRVFISSTFRDMQAERDHLVKVVFPRLRARLEPHRIHFVDIDLRWGVTKEQSDNDEVLELCLQEIDRCRPEADNRRPFFIGILGERYGWVPTQIKPEVLQRYAWVRKYADHSVTALEIIHGVLLNPPMHGQSFFYFRDPAFMADVPEAIREAVLDPESEDARHKQQALKQRARESGIPFMEDYPCAYAGLRIDWRLVAARLSEGQRGQLEALAADGVIAPEEWGPLPAELQQTLGDKTTVALGGLEAFGRQVEDDLWAGIAGQYPDILEEPAEVEEDPLAAEREAHQDFAEGRLRVYVGRDAVHHRLCEYLDSDAQEPLVLTGPSGSGKSAVLARLARDHAADHPDVFVLPHFIGASASSTMLASMLRRLCQELQGHFDFPGEIPDDPSELPGTFRMFLGMLPEGRRAVVIIDALDQLDARDLEMGLHWLPKEFPPYIKLVVSCLDDPGGSAILDELRERGHPEVAVEPLTDADREEITEQVPALSAKALDASQRAALLANPGTRNPLYLQVALEELRGFGSFDLLDDRIEHFRQAADVEALFGQVLERLEMDFGRALTEALCCLLAASRAGLSETELAAMLTGVASAKDMQVVLRQLRPYLQRRGELIDFYHLALKRAIISRYWADADDPTWHLRVADYFETADLGPRKLEELPWQLAQAREWQRLYDLLADVEFFNQLWRAHEFEARAYWAAVEANSDLQMVEAYRPVLGAPDHYEVWSIAELLQTTGHPLEALALYERLADHDRETGDQAGLQAGLGAQAVIMADRGDLEGALALHKEEERICRELGLGQDLQRSLGNQANVLHVRGDLDGALALHKEEERICRELGLRQDLGRSLGNQAVILKDRGDLDGAIALHQEQERICREQGLRADLQAGLGNQALVLKARGDLDGAMALHQEQERICRELGLRASLQRGLGNQALILWARGDLDGAMELYKEGERICRELGLRADLQKSLGNQALILQVRGDLSGAMALHQEKERICRELGLRAGLQGSLGSQALILQVRGDLDGAMALHQEQERICRELGLKRDLQTSLGNQALILKDRGDLEGAMELHKEEERICRELGLPDGLARSLANQSGLLAEGMGRPAEALPLAEEAYRLATEYGLTALAQQIKPILDLVGSMQP